MQLRVAIQNAIANPTTVNVRLLLDAFDQEIAHLPEDNSFQSAGDVIVQLAELIELRSILLLEDWEERHRPPCLEEPILTYDMLQDVLRQTMSLNLDDILELPERKEREASDSIVGEVAKENLIQFLDQLEQEEAKQAALAIAYEENITAWITATRHWINQHSLPVTFSELLHHLQMPFAQVWLALLLGDFPLEQRGDFYNPQSILIQSSTSVN